jgi:hypothetical protein
VVICADTSGRVASPGVSSGGSGRFPRGARGRVSTQGDGEEGWLKWMHRLIWTNGASRSGQGFSKRSIC